MQPRADRLGHRARIARQLDKRFLRDVLRQCRIARDSPRRGEHQAGVRLHKLAKRKRIGVLVVATKALEIDGHETGRRTAKTD